MTDRLIRLLTDIVTFSLIAFSLSLFLSLVKGGPLSLAQLEYNLPILTMGSSTSTSTSPTPITAKRSDGSGVGAKTSMPLSTPVFSTISNTTTPASASAVKINKTSTTPSVVGDDSTTACDNGSSDNNFTNKSKINNDIRENDDASLYEQKLIPENMVPEIIELLVTLGLIQQETMIPSSSVDAATAEEAIPDDDNNNHSLQQVPRFAVHFGQPRQFLVTPTNILSEISKAQREIQASRQRQELLKEALDLPDRLAAEKVKHIVLHHPQVVDDPVYVTALRNLQVDGMLMAGTTSGTTNLSSSINSPIKTVAGGGSRRGVGGGKRRQSTGGTQVKRKRRRSKKDPVTDYSSIAGSDKDNKATTVTTNTISAATAPSQKTSAVAAKAINVDTTISTGSSSKTTVASNPL
jgi:hypothetical protein